MQTGRLQLEIEEYDSTGKSGCKTKAHLIGASRDAICDARHRHEAIGWRLAVKLRGSSCAVCNATLNPGTLSEGKLLMLFFEAIGWRVPVKLRGSSCAVSDAKLNLGTLSEGKLRMFFLPSLTAGSVSSEQRVQVTTGTTTNSYEASTLLPATAGDTRDEVP